MPASNYPDTWEDDTGIRAVDGNIDPNLDNGHCAHPLGEGGEIASWEVTFDQPVVLFNVTVFM